MTNMLMCSGPVIHGISLLSYTLNQKNDAAQPILFSRFYVCHTIIFILQDKRALGVHAKPKKSFSFQLKPDRSITR